MGWRVQAVDGRVCWMHFGLVLSEPHGRNINFTASNA